MGSIPGLGWLFKKKDGIRRDVELMVFLRTKIVRTPEQAKELYEEMERKLPLIKEWRDEVDRDKESKAPAIEPPQATPEAQPPPSSGTSKASP